MVNAAPVQPYTPRVSLVGPDLSTLSTNEAIDALVTSNATGAPQLVADMAAQFNGLPPDQQATLLNRWLEMAKTGDGEMKVAVLFAVSSLANAATAPATRANFDAVMGQVANMQPYELPVRISSPEVRDARARVRAGRATDADLQLLCNNGVSDLLPHERAELAKELARRGRTTDLLKIFTHAPSMENARTALAECGGGDAWAGLQALRATADPTGANTATYQAAFNNVINKLRTATTSPMVAMCRELYLMAPTRGSAAAAPTTDSSSARTAGVNTISDAEAKANYQRLAAQLSRDGEVTVGDQLLLIEEALDPNHFYARLKAGDPELLARIKEDPGLLESIKTVMAAMNAAKDALIAINDDMNNRRKKYAESLGRMV